jgi:hypothetical protein
MCQHNPLDIFCTTTELCSCAGFCMFKPLRLYRLFICFSIWILCSHTIVLALILVSLWEGVGDQARSHFVMEAMSSTTKPLEITWGPCLLRSRSSSFCSSFMLRRTPYICQTVLGQLLEPYQFKICEVWMKKKLDISGSVRIEKWTIMESKILRPVGNMFDQLWTLIFTEALFGYPIQIWIGMDCGSIHAIIHIEKWSKPYHNFFCSFKPGLDYNNLDFFLTWDKLD